jgi:hypothetical protein
MSDKNPLIPTNNPPPPAYTSAPTAPPPGYQYDSPSPAPPPPPPGNQYGTTTNVTVVSTQPVRTQPMQGPPPRSYLVLAIVSVIFGFWPLGIVAILASIRVSGLLLGCRMKCWSRLGIVL